MQVSDKDKNGLIEAGKIVNTHGVDGKLKIEPWADSPGVIAAVKCMYIDGSPYNVLSASVHKSSVIARFEGVGDIPSAAALKNKVISVHRNDIKLEDGTYFVADLIGLKAINAETGEVLGTIADVLDLPANNVYVIKSEANTDTREIMVPAVSEFIEETNLKEKYIRLRLIEGL